METKYCKDCDRYLPFSEFGKAKHGKYGLKFYCKACKKHRDTASRRAVGVKERAPVFQDEYGKACTNCREYKLFENFAKISGTKGSRASWCKECRLQLGKKQRLQKGIVPKRYRREKNGLIECLECDLFLPSENFSPSVRGSYGLTSYCKPCVIKKFKSNRKIQNTRARKYRAKGTYRPAHRLRQYNRNALIKAMDDGTITKEFTSKLLAATICTYCKKPTSKDLRTLDHVKPLNKGGLHSASNIVMACSSCNSTKNDMDVSVFLEKYINK